MGPLIRRASNLLLIELGTPGSGSVNRGTTKPSVGRKRRKKSEPSSLKGLPVHLPHFLIPLRGNQRDYFFLTGLCVGERFV